MHRARPMSVSLAIFSLQWISHLARLLLPTWQHTSFVSLMCMVNRAVNNWIIKFFNLNAVEVEGGNGWWTSSDTWLCRVDYKWAKINGERVNRFPSHWMWIKPNICNIMWDKMKRHSSACKYQTFQLEENKRPAIKRLYLKSELLGNSCLSYHLLLSQNETWYHSILSLIACRFIVKETFFQVLNVMNRNRMNFYKL